MKILSENAETDIKILANNYRLALITEQKLAIDVASAEKEINMYKVVRLAKAYEDGIIDGKNVKSRDVQETNLLITDADFQNRLAELSIIKAKLSVAQIEVKYQITLISLTKAALYSLSFSALGKE